jgi:hypothetical protein
MIKSAKAKALLSDETFQDVIETLKQRQVKKFINSDKDDTIAREDAHSMIRALDMVVNELQSRVNDEKFIK